MSTTWKLCAQSQENPRATHGQIRLMLETLDTLDAHDASSVIGPGFLCHESCHWSCAHLLSVMCVGCRLGRPHSGASDQGIDGICPPLDHFLRCFCALMHVQYHASISPCPNKHPVLNVRRSHTLCGCQSIWAFENPPPSLCFDLLHQPRQQGTMDRPAERAIPHQALGAAPGKSLTHGSASG